MGILVCEFFFGKFEEEMKAYGQKWVTFCHTHTHTHTHTRARAAKLVVRIAWIIVAPPDVRHCNVGGAFVRVPK